MEIRSPLLNMNGALDGKEQINIFWLAVLCCMLYYLEFLFFKKLNVITIWKLYKNEIFKFYL